MSEIIKRKTSELQEDEQYYSEQETAVSLFIREYCFFIRQLTTYNYTRSDTMKDLSQAEKSSNDDILAESMIWGDEMVLIFLASRRSDSQENQMSRYTTMIKCLQSV